MTKTHPGRTMTGGPVRGTQSFVGVMSEVWKRPALTAVEVLWRWTFGAIVVVLVAERWGKTLRPTLQLIQAGGLSNFTVEGVGPLSRELKRLLDVVHSHLWVALCIVAAWIAVSAWGRGKVLQRINRSTKRNLAALLVLSAARVVCLLATVALWVYGVWWVASRLLLAPQVRTVDLPIIPFAAVLIVGTLGMFVVWMAASYIFQLAPVFAVEEDLGPWASVRAAARSGTLRGKVIEINLVLGIVKIALLVLAMVFSACPLPFSSVATEAFLFWWNIGVLVWYLLASDFFHVVRTAVYLRLWQVYEKSNLPSTPLAQQAS